MSADRYLKICEQLGKEPDDHEMPLSMGDFPPEMQVAFFMFGFLSDRWDGMNGAYLGKDWQLVPTLFEIYEVEQPQSMLLLMKQYEVALINYRAEKAERKYKKEQAKAKRGGKTYAHNIQG